MGYDRFYGFIGGETNQWYPDLAEDNHYVEQPYGPEDGYHLSKDLADKALQFIQRLQAVRAREALVPLVLPGRQPRAAPRAAGVHRQVQGRLRRRLRGVPRVGAAADDRARDPAGGHRAHAAQSDGRRARSPRPTSVRPWDTLSDDEKRLFSRMAEVYAGFSEYTDHQVGRIVDYLEESGQLDNTIIFYCADNGASGEGSQNGSVNEGKFFNALARHDRGQPAADRPARLARRRTTTTRRAGRSRSRRPTGCSSATRTRAASATRWSIHWPNGIAARGEVRDQYHHSTDIYPTILDALRGGDARGRQRRRSSRRSTASPCATRSTPRTRRRRRRRSTTRCSGTARLWHKGWKAVTEHGPISGLGNYDGDRWQLFHTDEDRAEAHDLAEQHPEKVEELEGAVVRGGGAQQRPPAQRHAGHRQGPAGVHRARVQGPGAAERAVHVLPGYDARCPSAAPPTSTPSPTRSWQTSSSPRRARA